MGGEWFFRRRATSPGSAPGWRTTSSRDVSDQLRLECGVQQGRLAVGETLVAGPQLAVSAGAHGEIDIDAAEALAAGAYGNVEQSGELLRGEAVCGFAY